MSVPSRESIAAAYNAAADHYDSLRYWGDFGERVVARAGLRSGEIVLDVCSGAGASAISAARMVGAAGRVIGLDLATALIAIARRKAAGEGLSNIEFRHADFDQAYFRPSSFDAVICAFGIFFFPDAPATLKKMWRFLRPGGRLALATWGPEAFEPGHSAFWNAVREVRPELYEAYASWERLRTPDLVRSVFEQAGIPEVAIESEDSDYALDSEEGWWAIVMGSSYRGTVDQLTAEEVEHVRKACSSVQGGVKTTVVYSVARKQMGT